MNFPYGGWRSRGQAGTRCVNALNFSDIGYDFVGAQVHADGEIWSATNFDIRSAPARQVPRRASRRRRLQRECADGQRPPQECPGNRRWFQLYYDAMVLMPTAPSMLDARNAILAADMIRFGGANQEELWYAFATRGFGQSAPSQPRTAAADERRHRAEAGVRLAGARGGDRGQFRAVARDEGNASVNARVYVGHYEARVSPIADTNPATGPADGTGNGRYQQPGQRGVLHVPDLRVRRSRRGLRAPALPGRPEAGPVADDHAALRDELGLESQGGGRHGRGCAPRRADRRHGELELGVFGASGQRRAAPDRDRRACPGEAQDRPCERQRLPVPDRSATTKWQARRRTGSRRCVSSSSAPAGPERTAGIRRAAGRTRPAGSRSTAARRASSRATRHGPSRPSSSSEGSTSAPNGATARAVRRPRQPVHGEHRLPGRPGQRSQYGHRLPGRLTAQPANSCRGRTTFGPPSSRCTRATHRVNGATLVRDDNGDDGQGEDG